MKIIKIIPWQDYDPFWEHVVSANCMDEVEWKAVEADVEIPIRNIVIDQVFSSIHRGFKRDYE